jgi:hypothetical protein
MSVACDFQVKPWEELLPSVAKGEVDAAIAGHVVSARALKQVDFTDRYFHTAARFAGRRDGFGRASAVARRGRHDQTLFGRTVRTQPRVAICRR